MQSNSSQFTYAELIRRETDQKAEELHRQYSRTSLYDAAWSQIGNFKQSSNRAVGWDIPNKLLAGDLTGKSPSEREAVYWKLARYEHLRWNVFQYTHGWVLLPREELTQEELRANATKRAVQKRHACLAPWEELDALPQARPAEVFRLRKRAPVVRAGTDDIR